MSNVTFASFTLETAPAVTDFLVGYRTAVAGGERRLTITSLSTVLGTVMPSSIAGTANQITASASTGAVTLSLAGPHAFTTQTSTAILLGAGSSAITSADMTYSTPTLTVPAGFGITGASSLAFTAASNSNITATVSGSGFVSVVGGGVRLDSTAKSLAAWGVTGPGFSALARTYTDTSSSGTVATAVANSFAQPTFAASNSTTYSDTATVLIGGAPAAGTNVSQTRPHALAIIDGTAASNPYTGSLFVGASFGSASAGTSVSIGGGSIYAGGSINAGTTLNSQLSNLTASNIPAITALQASFTATDGPYLNIGVAASTNNSAGLQFHYPGGAGSATNNVTLNLYNVSTGLKVDGNGQVSATASTDATTAGAGALVTSGGIYATKKIVSNGSVWDGSANTTFTGGAGNMTITAGTGNSRTFTLQTTTSGGTATNAFSVNATQDFTLSTGHFNVSTDTLSGAGAVSVTKDTTKLTSTGVAQAITLADGVDGQIKRIIHDVDGGSMVLTPTTKTGWSTATFTNAGDSLTLEFVTTRGWIVMGSYGTVVAP